ncbi:MAG: ankyrin repeat domain-containing protein [Gammaproteobacteria bacterium]|nr:ankyrin repeat domain-containing protein [Gammaproteobacteria bacterium]
MIKKILYTVILLVTVTIGFGAYNFKTMDIAHLTICAMDRGGVCKSAMGLLRGDEQDVKNIQANGGLYFIFAGYDGATSLEAVNKVEYNKRLFEISDYYLSKGVNINHLSPIDQLTPLHSAVLFNQVEVVKYLLKNGADKTIISPKLNKTPLELAIKLQGNGENDLSGIIDLLSNL